MVGFGITVVVVVYGVVAIDVLVGVSSVVSAAVAVGLSGVVEVWSSGAFRNMDEKRSAMNAAMLRAAHERAWSWTRGGCR